MRQQIEKLSTEIRRNYKSTFKTVTETTDTSSRRYVLANTTHELVNYELRRKMRRWACRCRTSAATCAGRLRRRSGRALGVASWCTSAKPPEIGDLPQPEQPVDARRAQDEEVTLPIPFVGRTPTTRTTPIPNGVGDRGRRYSTSTEHIETDFPQEVTCKSRATR